MLTPDDLALAESLLRAGSITSEQLEGYLKSLGAENKGKRLADLVKEAGLGASYAATMAPVGAGRVLAAPGGPSPEKRDLSFDQTLIPGESAASDSRIMRSVGGSATTATKFGRYEVVKEIARGGMGIVYRAHEPGLKRDVALKVMLAGEGASEEQIERFLREARAAAALQHPNIVQVHDVGVEKGMHYFAMDYIEGRPLDKMLKEEGALAPRMALRMVRDLARALQYAHEKGIIHRDIKPGNVLLAQDKRPETSMAKSMAKPAAGDQRNFRVLLSDFGLAKEMGAGSNLTLSGNLIGTPAYMSPEQAAGKVSSIDARSDVYSLGAVAYEILTGKVPFPGSTLAEVLADIKSAEPASMRGLRTELHRDVEIIVMKAMAKEKERRYQTAEEMADDIERYLNGEAILAAPPTLAYRSAKFARRHWAGVSAAVVSLVVLCVACGILGWRTLRDRREKAAAVAEFVRRARRLIELHDAKKLAEAQVQVNSALLLERDDPDALGAQRDIQLESLLVGVDAMVASKNWEGAKAVLDSDIQFRENPRVVAATRRVAGISTLSASSDEAGVEVDLVEPETGVLWDEETFPPVASARAAGLCRPLGAAPIRSIDVNFGDYLVVFSRGDRALLVLPARIPRSFDFAARYRVIRVAGPSADPGLDAVLQGATPGTIVDLAAGEYPPLKTHVPTGVLIRAARGDDGAPAKVVFRGIGDFVDAGGSHGSGLRDLEFQGAPRANTGVIFSSTYRASMARCRFTAFDNIIAACHDSQELLVRECAFTDSPEPGLIESSPDAPGGLFLMCRASVVGWEGMSMRARGGRIVRCSVERATRAGIWCEADGIEVSECSIRECPEWGIVVNGAYAVIRDNLVSRCATAIRTATPAAIAGADAVAVHNTVIRPNAVAMSFAYPGSNSRFLDNLVDGAGFKGLQVHDPASGWQFDSCLFHGCAPHCGITELDCPTLEDARAATRSSLARGASVQPHGMDCDPKFAHPEAADGLLAPDSPARGAGSDGTDIGARLEPIAADRISSTRWIVRDIARRYALRGLLAAQSGDAPAAAAWFRKAFAVDSSEPAAQALATRVALLRRP